MVAASSSDTAAGARPTYRPIARRLHWAMALLVGVIVPIGLYCASLRGVSGRAAERDAWLFWHKSFGLLVLLLALLRLGYRLRVVPPALPPTLGPLERALAPMVHGALYGLLFLAPLSGLLLSQGAGQPVSFFGLLTLPQLVPIDITVAAAARPQVAAGVLLHKVVFKYLLLALLALHIGAVIKHVWMDRDATFLRRMWGGESRRS
jgi:cytochrome b561